MVVLCDLFFIVTEYIDGFDAVVVYDKSKFEEAYAEMLLKNWLCALEGLSPEDGLEGVGSRERAE